MKTFKLDLKNMTGSPEGMTLPNIITIEYQDESVDNLVRYLTKFLSQDCGALDMQLNFRLSDFVTNVYRKAEPEDEPQKLNLADWNNRAVLTLGVRPDGHFMIMVEAQSKDKQFNAVYSTDGPLTVSEPSRIVYPH